MINKRMLSTDGYKTRAQTTKNSPDFKRNQEKFNKNEQGSQKKKPKSFYNLLMENGYINNPSDANSGGIYSKRNRREKDWNRLRIDKMLLDDF